MKSDLYQSVTNSIITAIESGVKPWTCPWKKSSVDPIPHNYKTQASYSGINVLLLWASATKNRFSTNTWLTYKQSRELGGQVRKGEKSTQCVFFNKITHKHSDNEKNDYFLIKPFALFNLDQIDGIRIETTSSQQLQGFDPIEKVEALLLRSGATIEVRGEKAFYSRVRDLIVMPERHRFSNADDFYITANHELTHWTGHISRLNRTFGKRYGDDSYAFEELVAEIGSAFINSTLDINGVLEHASYINQWVKILKNDKRAIFSAAKNAYAAYEYICHQ